MELSSYEPIQSGSCARPGPISNAMKLPPPDLGTASRLAQRGGETDPYLRWSGGAEIALVRCLLRLTACAWAERPASDAPHSWPRSARQWLDRPRRTRHPVLVEPWLAEWQKLTQRHGAWRCMSGSTN
jgi:hypothetical protein